VDGREEQKDEWMDGRMMMREFLIEEWNIQGEIELN
jgi:hypothetical protein